MNRVSGNNLIDSGYTKNVIDVDNSEVLPTIREYWIFTLDINAIYHLNEWLSLVTSSQLKDVSVLRNHERINITSVQLLEKIWFANIDFTIEEFLINIFNARNYVLWTEAAISPYHMQLLNWLCLIV